MQCIITIVGICATKIGYLFIITTSTAITVVNIISGAARSSSKSSVSILNSFSVLMPPPAAATAPPVKSISSKSWCYLNLNQFHWCHFFGFILFCFVGISSTGPCASNASASSLLILRRLLIGKSVSITVSKVVYHHHLSFYLYL